MRDGLRHRVRAVGDGFVAVSCDRRDSHIQLRTREHDCLRTTPGNVNGQKSMQHYEPLMLGRIRFSAGDFAAELELDRDGIVRRYEGLAERIA